MMIPYSRAFSANHAQQGFSLIELMIALVIGLVVVLGAGKLFLLGLQGSKDVATLSSKQEAVNFAANTLVRDIRRASMDEFGVPFINHANDNPEVGKLKLRLVDKGECDQGKLVYRVYEMGDKFIKGEGHSLNMGQTCVGPSVNTTDAPQTQPLVAGFANNGFYYEESASGSGVWRVGLVLYPDEVEGGINCDPPAEGEEKKVICFYAVNRTKSIFQGQSLE